MVIKSLPASSWLVYSNCAAMRRAAVDEGLCGWVAAGGMRAASATAVGLGIYAAANVQSDAACGWIADRQLGNWRLVCYGVSGLANMQLQCLCWVGGIDLAQYAWVGIWAAGRPAWRQSPVFVC